MKTCHLIAIGLAFALIASNVFWAYTTVNAATAADGAHVVARDNCLAFLQARKFLPALAPDASRGDVLRVARAMAPSEEPFEKEGFLWVGRIGFEFRHDKLTSVVPSWEPNDCPEP